MDNPFTPVGWYTDELPVIGSHVVFRVQTRGGRIVDITPGNDEHVRRVLKTLAAPAWWEAVCEKNAIDTDAGFCRAIDHVIQRCRNAGRITPPVRTDIADGRRVVVARVDTHPWWETGAPERETCRIARYCPHPGPRRWVDSPAPHFRPVTDKNSG